MHFITTMKLTYVPGNYDLYKYHQFCTKLEKDYSMTETPCSKNVVIFLQSILNFVMSKKIISYVCLQLIKINFVHRVVKFLILLLFDIFLRAFSLGYSNCLKVVELNWNNLFQIENQKVHNQNISINNTSEYTKVYAIYSFC